MNRPGQGRKSKSSHLKLIKGEKNKDRINEKAPKPEPKRPSCPSHLSKEAKKMWRFLAPQLEKMGVLTRIDGSVLASFCQAYGRWVEAERVLNKTGPLYKQGERTKTKTDKEGQLVTERSGGQVTTSPVLWVANKAMDQMNRFGSELGLSPASRERIRVEVGKDNSGIGKYLD